MRKVLRTPSAHLEGDFRPGEHSRAFLQGQHLTEGILPMFPTFPFSAPLTVAECTSEPDTQTGHHHSTVLNKTFHW